MMAEASGSRTHLRYGVPHNGFEARARRRPNVASGPIVAGQAGVCLDGRLRLNWMERHLACISPVV